MPPPSPPAASPDEPEWLPGSKLLHPFNPELGMGFVREVEGRFLQVYFPDAERDVTLSASGAGLRRLVLGPGDRARQISSGEHVEIAECLGHSYRLADGRELKDADLWPIGQADTPLERLASLRLDPLYAFRNRIAGLELAELREAGGLGSFLGGRIELFPHQLHAAMRAVESEPVRWLLADEVGLGKTVEACLILSALLRTGRANRALVLTPSTLTIQWLGELYRKFHQVFVVLDDDRIESVETDYGEGVNPFEVHPFAVASLEMMASDERLLRLASEAGLDVVVVDEAHRLVGPELVEAVGPLVRDARHAVLLTATPLQRDREGFYQLLAQLHPELYESFQDFDRAVSRGEAVVPFTSAVRRVDVGGLPPRVATGVDLPAWSPDAEISKDARTQWLVEQVPEWAKRGEKALVFVHELASLERLAPYLESRTGRRVTVFHEDLSPGKRDIAVAAFRESKVPILLCTEAGGEGRNFQFCDRIVHFDLPRDPVDLEQRIGRLDRIGRTRPVEIVYFRPQDGRSQGPDLARLFERLELFERPAAGLDTALAVMRPVLDAAFETGEAADLDSLVALVESARAEATSDLVQVIYRDAYTPESAESILARVPPDLEEKTQRFCVDAAEDLGFECVEKGGAALYYVELGARAMVDSLPGVEGGTRYLGTFDRAEAVEKEELEFFASGHPLVEGLLLELEDGVRGRATLMELPVAATPAPGLVCVYKDGPVWQTVVVEADGTPRPEWASSLLAALPDAKPVRPEKWGIADGWAEAIRALGQRAQAPGKLVAAAFFRPR